MATPTYTVEDTLFNFINGEKTRASTSEYLDNFEPAKGTPMSKVPRSSSQDVDAAIKAAKDALPAWSALAPTERADYLDKIAAAITAHMHELAVIESRDTGKPLSLALAVDIPRARDNFAFFAGAIRHDFTECHTMGGNLADGPLTVDGRPNTMAVNYTQRRPVGVAGLITPWNLPLYLLSWKVAPALAVGNTVVAKPSEFTPHTATVLAQICHAVGLPPGVFNVVHGTGAVAGQVRITVHISLA